MSIVSNDMCHNHGISEQKTIVYPSTMQWEARPIPSINQGGTSSTFISRIAQLDQDYSVRNAWSKELCVTDSVVSPAQMVYRSEMRHPGNLIPAPSEIKASYKEVTNRISLYNSFRRETGVATSKICVQKYHLTSPAPRNNHKSTN